ncbi:redoxin domain-containing protein [Gimesia aquarii]|uniref:Thiol-disulfide oxidoreductase ResA n=1 Tax=Gimesia aquarii TaxID=2527964 RepID=A0A517WS85_9PLAN|nr:redoxin domain-containing protein [Gimesia aquarii]QDU08122.1 Thiol-disulfide oxidoreductase ResA [Gimesia aquarii]
MQRFCYLILGFMSAILFTGTVLAESTDSLLGKKVENFSLKDFRGKTVQLSDTKDQKLVVIAFMGTECPLAKLYGGRLQKLSAAYSKQGVTFIAIMSNQQDSLTEIAAYARKHKITYSVLKDAGNRVADQIGAKRTPEIFVLDQDRKIRYHGRVDDQYGVGYIRDEPKREDLKQALTELLAGKPVSVASTEPVGCFIGRVREPDANSKVTYSNQIARIFQKHCVECHRAGEIAPFELTDYQEVAGWSETIAEVVRDQRMPPWHASPKHGTFANDRSLSKAEKELIYQWVEHGSPEGNPKDLPEPRTFVSGWKLPQEPDEVYYMDDKPFTVPAQAGKRGVKYKYFTVDPGFTEDKWLAGAEALPGNRAVVHHILVFARAPKGKRVRVFGEGDQFLVGYVPGSREVMLPKGMAKKVPAGSKLVFQMHYTPIGTEQLDRSKVGLVFTDKSKVTHQVVTAQVINEQFVRRKFSIPANDDHFKIEGTSPANDRNALLLGFMPHMHLRGKSFRYELRKTPDQPGEVLIDIPAFDFNWQTAYKIQKPIPLEVGDYIHCVAHFNNSDSNLSNPNPNEAVSWGDQTWNEMMIGYFNVAIPIENATVESEYKSVAFKLVRRRDKNSNGKLEQSEVPLRELPLFFKADQDKDAIVTVDELATMIEKSQTKKKD